MTGGLECSCRAFKLSAREYMILMTYMRVEILIKVVAVVQVGVSNIDDTRSSYSGGIRNGIRLTMEPYLYPLWCHFPYVSHSAR